MHAIADPPLARHRLSVDDYYRMSGAGILGEDDRVELIEGEIIDMAPIGSPHAASVKQLARALMAAVGDGAIVSVQDPIRLDIFSEPQPDLALLRPREDFYAGGHPGAADTLLVIEVAESSLDYDLRVKVPLYARHGVPEVWVLDLGARALHVHRQPAAGSYTQVEIIRQARSLAPQALPEAAIDLTGLLG